MSAYKIPVSVLVVIHDTKGRVLLLERADHPGFWQSVTGSLDSEHETPMQAAQRELKEETGLWADASAWDEWGRTQRYEIFPHWRHRYAPGVTHNTEHVFSVCVESDQPVTLHPREHIQSIWLDWSDASERCFSWTNVLAIRQLAARRGFVRAVSPEALVVASYNIRKGCMRSPLGLRSRLVIRELTQAVASLDADLVSLQEVQGRSERQAIRHRDWPSQPQHEVLGSGEYEAAYSPAAHYLHGHHGNALLSRFPIVLHETRDFSDHALEKRAVLHAVVAWGRESLHVFVVHFGLLPGGRMRQLDQLICWIKASVDRNSPLLVAGDFNEGRSRMAEVLRRELALLEALPEHSARAGRTFPSFFPVLRLDRIFQRGFRVDACHRAPRGPRWSRLSDHLPVVARLVRDSRA